MSQSGRSTKSVQKHALDEYLSWESQKLVEVVANISTDEKTSFIPVGNVKSYLTANGGQRLSNILAEIFKSDFPPIDPELILRDHIAIFCILLRIGHGKHIEHFARFEELSDRRLPFDPNNPPTEFPLGDHDPAFLIQFCEQQWRYCVPIFDSHMLHKHFGRQRILPIIHKKACENERKACGNERKAEKYVITVYSPHNKLLAGGKNTGPHENRFELKRYPRKDGEDLYRQEVNGFRSVRNTDSIIKFYGSYIHGDEFNILLEYADKGTLEEYFKNESPPGRGVDIIKFWEALFQLIKALKTIHSVRDGHFAVKPENIVVLSNGSVSASDSQFKLSNFGIDTSLERDREEKENEMQDTSAYEAPECYMPYELVNQGTDSPPKTNSAADIWSLGCIYSEAAIWIAEGYKGVVDYRKRRMAETDKILLKGGDCFHDGEKVLQSVLDAHRDIEDSLRRSDYITKDVLESMVDEMLWEEDRPNAKALLRKAEMLSSRARQKLSAKTGEEMSRPGSSQSQALPLQSFPPLRIQPPNAPLPPLPRSGPSSVLSSIAESHHPANVEKWRSQITRSQSNRSQFSAAGSDYSIQLPRQQIHSTATDFSIQLPQQQNTTSQNVSDLDQELSGSIASWQQGDTDSAASPNTALTSPDTSVGHQDYSKHIPNEGRPRVFHSSQTSNEYRRYAKPNSNRMSFVMSSNEFANNTYVPPSSWRSPPSISAASEIAISLHENDGTISPPAVDDPQVSPIEEMKAHARERSRGSSQSSVSPLPTLQNVRYEGASPMQSLHMQIPPIEEIEPVPPVTPPKSHKRNGLTLFPPTGPNNLAELAVTDPPPAVRPDTARTEITYSRRADAVQHHPVHRSTTSISSNTGSGSFFPGSSTSNAEYLSLGTCLEWKKAHKKVKKHSKVPPLPGANQLSDLKGRDHAFIIDDSASMATCWPAVKEVFGALSYVVKGMSPDGTELFYTVSYDTWRRKDTSDLVDHLEKKTTAGETNISYRLNLQLQAYRMKLAEKSKKKGGVRPINFYVLTNGEWGKGKDVRETVREMADWLAGRGLLKMVSISFISFAQTEAAVNKIADVINTDFAVDIVDATRWDGNVLKMLKGALDKEMFVNEGQNEEHMVVNVSETIDVGKNSWLLSPSGSVGNGGHVGRG